MRLRSLKGAPRNARYEPVARIGVGAAGLVFEALDRLTGESVALKILRRLDADSRLRAKAEFRSLRDVVHPNVTRLIELAEGEDGTVFFTMELIRGVDLLTARGVRASNGFADGGAALRDAIGQLADGLAAIHAFGKLHRDVKPSNVMVETDGRVVVLDFGGVREIGATAAPGGAITVSGSPVYMAPEQYQGRYSAACDWFSLGVVLYEALSGNLPFDPGGALPSSRHSPAHPSSIVPDAPRDLGDLALALLSPDPSARAGEREVRAACPAPIAWMRREREAPFIGRTTELAYLAGAFDALDEERPVLVSVEGPSGYGKTALIERFLDGIACDPAALVLRSRCHPQESVRYDAFDGLVDELARHLSPEPGPPPASLTPEGAAALRHVFPVLERIPWIEKAEGLPPGIDPADMRRAAFTALRAILACVAAERPTVLWIDDLQWGKADSIPLLREILLAEDAPAALFLVSFRTDQGEGSAIVAALEAARIEIDRPSTSIELGPLPPRDAIALAASVLDEPPEGPQHLAVRVNAEADGSPIFLTLLARALARRAHAPAAEEEWTLARVVAERLAELPEEAIGLLETLSVFGGPLRRSAVYEAAGLGPAPHRLVAALQQERWIRLAPGDGEPALAMAHDRIAEVVRAGMTKDEARGRHETILEALESIEDRPGSEAPSTPRAPSSCAWPRTSPMRRATAPLPGARSSEPRASSAARSSSTIGTRSPAA